MQGLYRSGSLQGGMPGNESEGDAMHKEAGGTFQNITCDDEPENMYRHSGRGPGGICKNDTVTLRALPLFCKIFFRTVNV